MPTKHRFVALYEGDTVCGARLVAATADPHAVRNAQRAILQSLSVEHDRCVGEDSASADDWAVDEQPPTFAAVPPPV